jgi:hypothetical protein
MQRNAEKTCQDCCNKKPVMPAKVAGVKALYGVVKKAVPKQAKGVRIIK